MSKTENQSQTLITYPNRWKALILLSLAQFLVILDTSIIGVALPTIQEQFGFSQSGLQWIFSAYVIVFGALLLLGGRLADIMGQRKIFVIGFATLTAASVLAGLAPNGNVLIAARALQGIGAALIAPAAMSIVLGMFSLPAEKGKALGIWGASAPAGGIAGVFLGGVITAYVDWSWVFLINVPIGIGVLALTWFLLPRGSKQKGRVDFPGALAITAALILLVYVLVTGNDSEWASFQTIGGLGASAGLFVAFGAIQRRSKSPLVPLAIFKVRNLLAGNVVMALLGAAWIPMWIFLNLYLQQVQGYGPFESGLALMPMTAAIMLIMIGASSKIIGKLGAKTSLVAGLAVLSSAMAILSVTPAGSGGFFTHVLPASLVAAAGMSLAYIPALTTAVSNARNEESGLASGIVNTSYQIGSAIGLAIMVAVASSPVLDIDFGTPESLEGPGNGFRLGFVGSSVVAGAAAIVAFLAIRKHDASDEMELRLE